MRHLLLCIILSFLALPSLAQEDKEFAYINEVEQSKDDIGKSVKQLRIAAVENDDAESYFELAKTLLKINNPHSRYLASKYFQEAIYRDPNNLAIRYEFAKLLRYETPQIAFGVYEDIVNIDSTQSEAYYQMARIREDDYLDYNNSIRIASEDVTFSLDSHAYTDFKESEKLYLKALEINDNYTDALLHLSTMYEESGHYDKAVEKLEQLIEVDPANKDAYLYLGMMHYRNEKMEKAYEAYQKAIYLMTYDEKEDFTYNSVIDLLLDKIGGELMTKKDIKLIISAYWKSYDPLLLTDYNERLLEHYTRVAYSNLRFSVPHKNIVGWKTDRGETYIRYGEPYDKYTIRPEMGTEKPLSRTEVWHYPDMSIAFADKFWTGNPRFAAPEDDAQIPGDFHSFMELGYPEYYSLYNPIYDGPYFEVPYDIIQFKNLEREGDDLTDLYVTYAINKSDNLDQYENGYAHQAGLFFLNNLFETMSENEREIKSNEELEFISLSEEESYVNSIGITAYPDSGHMSFEIIRTADKGFASNKGRYRIKNFPEEDLAISDVVLASKITTASNTKIKRGDIGIVPNPTHKFSAEDDLFVYYEVYNLTIGGDNLNRFEQEFVIERVGEVEGGGFNIGDIFNPVLSLVGLGGDDEVKLTSEYKTLERNPRIYVQIDMSNYEPGEYMLTTIVRDKLSGNEVSSDTYILWE